MSEHDRPNSTADAVRMVSQAIAASHFDRAASIAETALAEGLIDPALYNARAMWLERQGRDEEALTEYRRARALAPRGWAILNAIGLCLTRLYRLDEALEAFDEAIRINPAYAASHQRRGVVLGMSGRARAAEESYRRAVALDPRNAEALASLASIAGRKGDNRTAQLYASRALAIDTNNATANAALALVEISQREYAQAEARLRPLLGQLQLSGHGLAVVWGLLGDALDGLQRFPEAFAAYEAANKALHDLHAPRFHDRPAMASTVESLQRWFEASPPEAWASKGTSGGQAATAHVFLLGFYRSGTTLLEQVLESHPGIVTLEERDFLADAAEHYLANQAGFEGLVTLDDDALRRERAGYWARVAETGIDCRDKVFVDKHPLNGVKLPLIRRLFPEAKILLALRDPRDVVLSCFRRHFEINAVMYEFLTLEGTARLYDRVMALSDAVLGRIKFDVYRHRYEDLISDFDSRVRLICDFLAVPYDESMKSFARTAARLDIRSPSARQVEKGLFTEGVGQWRNYESQLAPVLPELEPWAKRFGY